jgi:hypothetical protein
MKKCSKRKAQNEKGSLENLLGKIVGSDIGGAVEKCPF